MAKKEKIDTQPKTEDTPVSLPEVKTKIKTKAKPGTKKKKTAAEKKKSKRSGGNILIVESPTKVHTIKKFLGAKFRVLATKGHVKDLPKSKLGVDVDNNFEPHYIIMRDKIKLLNEIKRECKDAEEVYIGTDPDREGEAICWHVAEEIKKSGAHVQRVMFNEITKNAVLKAIAEPREINMNLVNSQQSRRILDRLVGYKISPMLWKAIKKGLSAGRVQSVALKLVVERQKEIDAFKPVEYWSLEVILENGEKIKFTAKLVEKDGVKVDLVVKEDTEKITAELANAKYIVSDIVKKERQRKALPPFITSTMQQEAAKKYRFTAQKTMMIAQQLYEGINIHGEGHIGLISYMRTDSLRVTEDAQKEALSFIETVYGKDFRPAVPNFYKSKKSAQDAHEAIRPTAVNRAPELIKTSLNTDQFKLYTIIWQRFVASQMTPAVFDDTRVRIQAGAYLFQANGSVKKFDGFLKVYDTIKETETEEANAEENDKEEAQQENQLPLLNLNEELRLIELVPGQHFTQPPAAYSDATLVKALEEKDIGRPSTYAPIISTLVIRKYVMRDRGKFAPTELGILVWDVLGKHFSEIINEEFTAKMEDSLDMVEEGTVVWTDLLREFYTNFDQLIKKAEPHMSELKKDIEGETGLVCEQCGGKMIIKWGRHGKFMACANYPTCKNAKPIGGEKPEDKIEENCPQCGAPLMIKHGPFGKFIACSKYPECKYTRQIVISMGVKCPDCGEGDLIERTFRKYRKFYGCSTYPKCKFMIWDKPVPTECPQCKAPFLLEKWKKDKTVIYCKKCDYKEEKDMK
ncbi:MAG: type I DNA topoisomerase [bacterium]